VLLQLSVYPTIADMYGVLYTYRLGCFLFAIMLFLLPLITLFKSSTNTRAVWALLTLSLTLTGTASMFTLISIYILINNSCYSHERATVNGIGQVFASIGRFCGPFLIYEIIANNGSRIPMDWLYNCFILGVISLLNSRLALLLPRSIERRKREPREPRYALSASSGDYVYEEHYEEMEDLLIPPEDTPFGATPPYSRPEEEERERDREIERGREVVFTQTMSTASNDASMSSSLYRAAPLSLSSSPSASADV
jgi:MFS family permease